MTDRVRCDSCKQMVLTEWPHSCYDFDAVERWRQCERAVVEAAVAYCHPPESDPWGYGDDERYSTLRDRVQDFVDLRAAAQTGNGGGE